MKDDRIQIRGNKDGINAILDMSRFSNFDEMLNLLIDKLMAGRSFYKGSSLKITANLSKVSAEDIARLKDVLFERIQIKECVFEEEQKKENIGSKVFAGVYEGKTKFIKKTVRGGQLINYAGNIVIIGDINSGAEVHAAGNIVVLGTIKGQVHAGVGGNDNAIICALCLQPEILEIAGMITISPDDNGKPSYPELAMIKNNMIVVEPYLPNKYIY
ncbi:septum site-determining protein MinC [Clostridium sp.]|uniref:septum site-determining protein MinC n=1 Tax=Clostridium sp. TaxID=1506 RepID=UPI003F344A92